MNALYSNGGIDSHNAYAQHIQDINQGVTQFNNNLADQLDTIKETADTQGTISAGVNLLKGTNAGNSVRAGLKTYLTSKGESTETVGDAIRGIRNVYRGGLGAVADAGASVEGVPTPRPTGLQKILDEAIAGSGEEGLTMEGLQGIREGLVDTLVTEAKSTEKAFLPFGARGLNPSLTGNYNFGFTQRNLIDKAGDFSPLEEQARRIFPDALVGAKADTGAIAGHFNFETGGGGELGAVEGRVPGSISGLSDAEGVEGAFLGAEGVEGVEDAGALVGDAVEGGAEALEQGVEKTLGRTVRIGGGLLTAGTSIYKDVERGNLGNNWWSRIGNVMNIAGSGLEVAGAYGIGSGAGAGLGAGAELLGGITSLIGTGLEEIGDSSDAKEQEEKDTAQVSSQVQARATPSNTTVVAGRSQ